jgi:hypothetical protein
MKKNELLSEAVNFFPLFYPVKENVSSKQCIETDDYRMIRTVWPDGFFDILYIKKYKGKEYKIFIEKRKNEYVCVNHRISIYYYTSLNPVHYQNTYEENI